jgi:hypothetical protein
MDLELMNPERGDDFSSAAFFRPSGFSPPLTASQPSFATATTAPSLELLAAGLLRTYLCRHSTTQRFNCMT